MEIKDLYAKYNVVEFGPERYYISNLKERFFDSDFITPVSIMLEDQVFEDRSWVQLILKIAKYLNSKYVKPLSELYAFRTDWSKAEIYSDHAFIANSREVEPNLYISVNYTSLHSVWIIQDLLNFYNVDLDTCLLVVHKPPKAEPKEIQEAVENRNTEGFKAFLSGKGYDTEKVEKVVKGIKVFNKILCDMESSYNNFFIIDNAITFANYKAKFFNDLSKYVSFTESQIKSAHKYLDFLTEYYTSLKTTWNKYKKANNIELTFKKPNGVLVSINSIN